MKYEGGHLEDACDAPGEFRIGQLELILYCQMFKHNIDRDDPIHRAWLMDDKEKKKGAVFQWKS